ncbi:MAG: V-type ATP synthase subunit B [Eubacteriales bacterium]
MSVEYIGAKEISGNLMILEGIHNASFEELVEIKINDQEKRLGRIIELFEGKAVIQVFEGTQGISGINVRSKLVGRPLKLPLSKEIIGRTFDGVGRPIDGLGEVYPEKFLDINGEPLNPNARLYPRDFIQTGVSAIDSVMTLIRGQKLPVFSGNGLPHDALAVQIVRQAQLAEEAGNKFAIVFAAMGVKNDVAHFFKKSFEESGVLQKVVMFLNLANDPVVERITTPRCALTAAEYLAFEENMHVLVILTDMTSYCEALREISSSKGEVPSRKGFPGYMYSDLAMLYERAGMLKDIEGSVTQIPILTMPNDDITHPIPDLTGYITEGQIVLSRELHQKGVYPPINVLPSLSRLMKDGIGKGYTRFDHPQLATQLFASYAHVQEVIALSSVIGEDELTETDKKYMKFGKEFQEQFVSQKQDEDRPIEQTLDLGWKLLGILPKEELDRIDDELIDEYYEPYIEEE